MPSHKVAQGDCLLSIAEKNGFFWETLWEHPNNAELKKKRDNPAILLPGDVVFVPEKQIKEVSEPTNQVHKFKVKNSPAKLNLRFLDDSDKPRANLKYVLSIDGQEFTGVTDGQGAIKVSIPPQAKSGKLIFEEENEEYDLFLGFLDPIDKITGIQARLKGLGFYKAETSGKMDEKTKEAIREYQITLGLEPTGELDDELRNKIKNAYGS